MFELLLLIDEQFFYSWSDIINILEQDTHPSLIEFYIVQFDAVEAL
jgi:hypothetical protein